MDYTEIKNAILGYSDRKDQAVIDAIDMFLRVVESRVNRKLKTQYQSMRTQLLITADQQYYGLPSDFLGLRDIEVSSGADTQTTLEYVTPAQLNDIIGSGQEAFGPTKYYTIVAKQLQIYPVVENMVLEIVYYQSIPPLEVGTPENWLSITYPDTYIFGGMVELSAFIKDAVASNLWEQRFVGVVTEIATDDKNTRWSGPPMRIR